MGRQLGRGTLLLGTLPTQARVSILRYNIGMIAIIFRSTQRMQLTETLDQWMGKILFVTVPPPVTVVEPETGDVFEEGAEVPSAPAERRFGLSLIISGVRCTLQYMVLPVVLPLIGLAGDFSLALVLLLDVIALSLLVSSLRYFWRNRHPRRFDILPLSGVILLLILGSLSFDLWQVFN
ncbi:hypothetical protein [Candidatus Chloroploca mongolica]|nr:hypothetical protein [Candidatus Chloroploca mongolica]